MRKTALLLTLTMFAAGCSVLGLGPQHVPDNAAELAKLPYPRDAKYGDDLDILAVRHGDSIDLVNRTPMAYDKVQVWLNQQWVMPIDKLAIGDPGENHMALGHFVNEHAQPYPLGGLLTPDRDQVLVIAELYNPATGLLHRLLVRNP